MVPDIDSNIYTKVVDLEETFILICILYIRYNRKLSKKSKKQGNFNMTVFQGQLFFVCMAQFQQPAYYMKQKNAFYCMVATKFLERHF